MLRGKTFSATLPRQTDSKCTFQFNLSFLKYANSISPAKAPIRIRERLRIAFPYLYASLQVIKKDNAKHVLYAANNEAYSPHSGTARITRLSAHFKANSSFHTTNDPQNRHPQFKLHSNISSINSECYPNNFWQGLSRKESINVLYLILVSPSQEDSRAFNK